MEARYDLIILGAGPAGAAAMLALRGSGRRVLVVDKAGFPRHKPCGDAIPYQAIRELENVWPGATEAIAALPSSRPITGCRLYGPDGKGCYLPFVNPGMTATRIEFDELLFHAGLEASAAEYRQAEARQAEVQEDGVRVIFKDGSQAEGKLLIGADGAYSVAARALPEADKPSYPAAARYHLQGSLADEKSLYIWFPPGLPNGYFWAFPLREGRVNAGIGAFLGKGKRLNLKQDFHALLSQLPEGINLSQPTAQDAWLGQAVPCDEPPLHLCGDRILLAGDAAGLVQAATGEGIGHAVVSGVAAAKAAMEALRAADLSHQNLERLYARPLMARLEKTIRRQHSIVRWAMRAPWMIGLVIGLARRSGWVAKRLRSI